MLGAPFSLIGHSATPVAFAFSEGQCMQLYAEVVSRLSAAVDRYFRMLLYSILQDLGSSYHPDLVLSQYSVR